MSQFLLWFKIIRPQTLFASLCPVLVILHLVAHSGADICTPVAISTVLCALALQILSNLINDYYDFLRGSDRKGRAGFQRALAEGLVSEAQMRRACFICLACVLLFGLHLIYIGGLPILLIGLSAILFAWLYTATSRSLSYLGIADIFVFLYYGVIAGWGTLYLQMPHLDTALALTPQVLCASSVNGLISMCVLIINNLRDMDTDRQVGKRTFPVRFGKRAGEIGMAVIVLLTPLFAWMAFRSYIPCLVIIPALAVFFATTQAQGTQYNKCLIAAGLTNLVYLILTLFA